MKLFLPQIKEEFTLEKDWNIDLDNHTAKHFFGIDSKKDSVNIWVPAGTKMFLTRIDLWGKRKIGRVGLLFSEINGKKFKTAMYNDFSVDLNDLNRIHIQSSATQGVLNIEIGWYIEYDKRISKGHTYQNKLVVGDIISTGRVNNDHIFTIRVSEIEYITDSDKNRYSRHKLKSIKYQAFENVSKTIGEISETFIPDSEWTTLQTCQKHAFKFLNNNKNKFLNPAQNQIMRSEKFNRLADELNGESEN